MIKVGRRPSRSVSAAKTTKPVSEPSCWAIRKPSGSNRHWRRIMTGDPHTVAGIQLQEPGENLIEYVTMGNVAGACSPWLAINLRERRRSTWPNRARSRAGYQSPPVRMPDASREWCLRYRNKPLWCCSSLFLPFVIVLHVRPVHLGPSATGSFARPTRRSYICGVMRSNRIARRRDDGCRHRPSARCA